MVAPRAATRFLTIVGLDPWYAQALTAAEPTPTPTAAEAISHPPIVSSFPSVDRSDRMTGCNPPQTPYPAFRNSRSALSLRPRGTAGEG